MGSRNFSDYFSSDYKESFVLSRVDYLVRAYDITTGIEEVILSMIFAEIIVQFNLF